MRREDVPDIIINKAVDIWCKKLLRPQFDNGDTSENGFFGMVLATINIETAKSKIKDMPNRVEIFRKSLTDNLLRIRDTPNDKEYFPRFLDVDYGPCRSLVDASAAADIPHSQFSCKSSVHMADDKVTASFGYGAPRINYYPLPDGKWLLTTLLGDSEDMNKIITSVMAGNPLGLKIED